MAVRSLGVPRNKEIGAMVHGLLGERFYYSAGVFNGEGPEFRNADNQPDGIGRMVLTPLGAAQRVPPLAIGASGWYGLHELGAAVSGAGDARRRALPGAALGHRPGHAAHARDARARNRDGSGRGAEPAARHSLRDARRGGLEATAADRGRRGEHR